MCPNTSICPGVAPTTPGVIGPYEEDQLTDSRHARPNQPNTIEAPVRLEQSAERTTFPREPQWWRSSVLWPTAFLDNFNPADISIIADDLERRRQKTNQTPENVAGLLRRQWALLWLADVSNIALRVNPIPEPLEHHCRQWQTRAAIALAESTWSDIVRLPPDLTAAAIRLAIVDPSEPNHG